MQIDRAFIKYTTSMVNAQGWENLKARAKNSTTYTSIFYTTLIQSEMSMRCVYETFLHCTMLHGGGGGNKSRNSKTNFWDPSAPIWLDIMHVFKQFAMYTRKWNKYITTQHLFIFFKKLDQFLKDVRKRFDEEMNGKVWCRGYK